MKDEDDDILIVKNGLITDSSFCNIIFKNEEGLFTPLNPLLKGTKRQYLLDKNIIKEREIYLQNLNEYNEVILINAMIDIEDNINLKVENIHF